jgi:hypothetical protein
LCKGGVRKIGEQPFGPIEAGTGEKAPGEIVRTSGGEQIVDAELRDRVRCTAQREAYGSEPQLEHPVAPRRLEVIMTLRGGAADQLDLAVVEPEASISRPPLRFDRAIIGKQDALRTTFDDGRDDVEHLLFSDGFRFIRIDLAEGSLIGCPSSLRYKLRGIAGIRRPLPALQRLVSLIERGRIPRDRDSVSNRRERWILELRVADALASGATQQEIASVLFGSLVTSHRWRAESSAYRQRVQRLARGARARLRQPLDRGWF